MKPSEINLSPSFLGRVLEKGYDYAVGEKLGLFPREDTPAMEDGRLIHGLLAERFGVKGENIVISPYDNFRTKEAREWRDSQDGIILKEEKLEQFNSIVNRVVNHPRLKPFLDKKLEPELRAEKQVGDYNVKGFIDLLSDNEGAKSVIDYKYISSQNFDNFEKKALWMNYDLQASMYDYLTGAINVYYLIIENQAPHRIKLFHCDESFLQSGAEKFNKAMKIIKEAKGRQPTFDIDEVGTLMSWEHYG